MTRARLWLSLSLALTLALAACGSSGSSSNPDGSQGDTGGDTDTITPDGVDKDTDGDTKPTFVPVSVDTVVEPAGVQAGGTVTVYCVGQDATGAKEELPAVYAVTPAEGASDEGATLTLTKAGDALVACTYEDLVDDTPASVSVTPGAAAKVITTLGVDTIPAGGSTTVACTLEDMYGNSGAQAATAIEAPPEVTVGSAGVTTTHAGDWEITCTIPANPDAETVPATLTVTALDPVELDLYLKPEKDHYTVGTKVTVKARGLDQYGNKTADVELASFSYDPMEGIQDEGQDKVTFLTEGHYTFSGTMADEPGWSDTLDVVVDGTGPLITIAYPDRGLQLDTTDALLATGTIVDAISAVETFTLNGEPVQIGEGGAWTATMPDAHGQNRLVFEARDEWGNKAKAMRAYHYSSGYTVMDTAFPEDSMIDDAIVAFLGQGLFYDEADPDNPATLSAIAQTIFAGIDLATLIPSPATNFSIWPCNDGYDIYISNLLFDEADILVKPVDGGIHLKVVIPNFSMDFLLDSAGGALACGLKGTSGKAKADSITLIATLFISLDANGQPLVEMGQPTVSLQNLTIEGSSFGSDVLALLFNVLKNLLTGIIQGVIEDLIKDQVVGLLQDGLSALIMDMPIEFDLPLGEGIPVTLHLLTGYSALQFAPDGGLLGVAATIRAQRGQPIVNRGAIQHDGCLGALPATGYAPVKDAPVELAAFDDLLNQAAYAAWLHGILHLTLTAEDFASMNLDLSQYGIKDMNLGTDARLPPAIEGCGEDGRRLVQMGDVFVHATFEMTGKPVDLSLYLHAQTSLDITVSEVDGVQKVAIVIAPFDYFDPEIVAVNEEWAGKEGVFENLLGGILKQVLEDQLANMDLSFEIPSIGLGGLVEGLPADLGLAIDIQELKYEGGYTIAKASPMMVTVDPEQGGGLSCSGGEGGGLGCSSATGNAADAGFVGLLLLAVIVLRRRLA